MAKLTILKGLPASGKTTLARQIVIESGNTVRVNKDDLWAMLFGSRSKWTGRKWELVLKTERAAVQQAFAQGLNVVVDDTNLKKDHWSGFSCPNYNKTEVINMKVPLDECIYRDKHRQDGRVGRAVIERMALEAGLVEWPLKQQLVVCDIDGTIADLSHRLECIKGEKKDYDLFWKSVVFDKPLRVVIKWLQMLQDDYYIVLVSGRSMECAIATENWLEWNHVPFKRLFMRKSGDFRDDTVIKQEILDMLPLQQIEFAIDDRPRIVRDVWRAGGIKVYPVHQDGWEGVE